MRMASRVPGLGRLALTVASTLLCWSALPAQAPLARISANDNRTPAGVLRNGVLRLQLDVVRAMWHPDRADEPGVDVLAFAERGHAPSIPAPLIRVPVGTAIHTTIRNTLADSTIIVWGLAGARGRDDTVRIEPGETRELVTRAAATGTFFYRAATNTTTAKPGNDRMLAGAFIVDPPNARSNDRVFVLLMWVDTIRLREMPGASAEIPSINGKAWPNTERLTYDVGDTITWRIVNPSFDPHPMHLHGTYFQVLTHGDAFVDSVYDAAAVRQAVTERLFAQQTRVIRWVAPRAGMWLFHCHLTFHIMPHPPLGDLKAADEHADHALHGMGGLVMATYVRGEVAPDETPRRRLRVVVQQYDSVPGEYGPPFSYEFDDARNMTIPGPAFIVTQNEPIAITVVNRAQEPTSIHWHGLEIESYYDGVPNLGGTPQRTTPLVAVNDSFVVKMTPPRAGTFIYHSHADEVRQQGGGLFGAFIVLPPGEQWHGAHERVIVLSTPRDTSALAINGADHPTIELSAGETYRLRIINITLDRPNIVAFLQKAGKLESWNLIAKDGADLPPAQGGMRPAGQAISIGETYDFLYTPAAPGELSFEIETAVGELLRSARVVVK